MSTQEENLKALQEQTKEGVSAQQDTKDANVCMALGAGVGTLGAVTAAITGAVCPLCIFVAPGLIGVGAYKRWKSKKSTIVPPKF